MEAAATIGHNNPPEPSKQFRFNIDTIIEQVKTFPEITEENKGEANDVIRSAGNLAKEIDSKRTELKKPHLDAGREIDRTYKPLEAEAKDCIKPLKDRLGAYLREQERIAREEAAAAARKAEEERLAAERAAALAEPEEAHEAEQKAEVAETRATAAEAQAKHAATAKGSYGLRASGLRTKYVTHISDPVALVRHYHKHQAIIEACKKLAEQEVRANKGNVNIPGIIVKEERSL